MKRKFSDCLAFAEGNGKIAINKVKSVDFPDSLISDQKSKKIVELRKCGLSLREIATEMNYKNQTTVLDHIKSFKKRKQLYDDWVDFWIFIEPIRTISIDEVAENIYTEKQLKIMKKKGVCTIGDYLNISVKMPVRNMQIFIGDTKSDYKKRREKVFSNIKHLISEIK